MEGFIARALAFLTEGIFAPKGVLAPVSVRLKVEANETRRTY